ncbi:hypothetical protein AVEN_126423-1, partial [Araneus ventricosus]
EHPQVQGASALRPDARGGHEHLRLDPHGGQGDPTGDSQAPSVAGEGTSLQSGGAHPAL